MQRCGTEYGVGCHSKAIKICSVILVFIVDPGTCTDGQLRLIDGLIDQEGRLEVCVGGVWGGVCGAQFGASDAYIACKDLGYLGPSMCACAMHVCMMVI